MKGQRTLGFSVVLFCETNRDKYTDWLMQNVDVRIEQMRLATLIGREQSCRVNNTMDLSQGPILGTSPLHVHCMHSLLCM